MKLIRKDSIDPEATVIDEMRFESDNYILEDGEVELDQTNPLIKRTLSLTVEDMLMIRFRNRRFIEET